MPTTSDRASSPSRRVLVIAHEPDGPGGQVAVRLAERGYEIHTHVVTPDVDAPNTAAPLPDFADYDLVALMGSIRSLTRKDEISSWVHDELASIRAAAAREQPILGVCFGGQLIADALGGSVEESPVFEIGWHRIDPMPGVDNPVGAGPWMEWHHDRFDPPPGAAVLASTAVGPQLFTIGRMVGTQFHPEVDHAHVAHWLGGASPEYLAEVGIDPDALLAEIAQHEDRNTLQCHALVDWFLAEVGLDPLPSAEGGRTR